MTSDSIDDLASDQPERRAHLGSGNRRTGRLSARAWPIGIALFLMITTGFDLIVVAVATNQPSMAVEPDYYVKAVDWDAYVASQKRFRELGWRFDVELQKSAARDSGGTVVAAFVDRDGTAITGADVGVDLFPHVNPERRYHLTLSQAEDGRYSAAFPQLRVPSPGSLWECEASVVAGKEQFTKRSTTQWVRPPVAATSVEQRDATAPAGEPKR